MGMAAHYIKDNTCVPIYPARFLCYSYNIQLYYFLYGRQWIFKSRHFRFGFLITKLQIAFHPLRLMHISLGRRITNAEPHKADWFEGRILHFL